uniref:Uncharacterized protein n=1 Tax=Triticum urartu TaxID=4572 RepID=A0A8R7Q447_TRIUA
MQATVGVLADTRDACRHHAHEPRWGREGEVPSHGKASVIRRAWRNWDRGRPMWRLVAGLRRGRQIWPELCTWCGDCGPRVLLVVGTKRRSLALSAAPLRTASCMPHRVLPGRRRHALPSPCLM